MVKKKPKLNLNSIQITLIANRFVANDLKTIILVSTLRDKKKKYTLILTNSVGLIKKLVDKSLYPPLNEMRL